MIHLAWPWMASLLPLPWLVYRTRSVAPAGGAALFLPFAASIAAPAAAGAAAGGGRRALFAVIWTLLVLAAMRPQWLGEPLPAPTTGRRILLAVDVSGSMATTDMANDSSRLQVVQQVAGRFIDGRRGDQVGLILFGTRPYVQAPVTADLATVHRFLDEAMVGVAGTQTAIGDAIGMAIKRLRAAGGRPGLEPAAKHTVLILLTDGQSNAGVLDPLQAARFAKQVGLRIYTIGVGAAAGSGFFGLGGNNDLDEGALRKIAKITGGEYFRATDADALQRVYRRIDKLEPAAGRAQWLRPTSEWFLYPLAAALLLSIPAAALGGRAWA
ncbi:MAG TPA: VWA domain-containing protein [Steroidobacteraceae bacterium]|nr:VWA domain-containing protein [Steroidobacteraceae bacterium]